ncbi:Formate hydrogenlyase subunit 7 [Clostridium liquoris]|jgi:membrane-bound hydrogenase subunit mbhJ|uniref:Formate hydrogenlyase subunit 7 n=1 Tax=Clostridium liquoris TaxID=1289519 RepID=A0A2T0B4C3_9CLOT|nr:NADH-quinone oxidoreductase subunit B family protein [Clostridium liquoris]PRR78734.1 Formate hydrogenlyase subunit 7 [Clostridium liquoris]
MEKLLRWSRSKSPWIYHLNTGSCNGCDIELMALLGPKYDLERFGIKLTGTPKHADIVVVTGPVTTKSKDRMLRILSQIPEPKVVVSLGSCPMSCNVFKGSYCVEGPLDRWTHVDVSIGGCPPKPEAMMEGILQAVKILKEKGGEDKRG